MISCGGGGGGAASASLPDSEYTTHNPGGWSTGIGGGSSGGSSGGTSGGSGGAVEIQGFTPLVVTGYIFDGATYPDVTALTRAMAAAGATSPSVTFTVAGESTPRTARVTKTNEGYNVEHQYKATLSTGETITYYANDGVNLSAQTTGTIKGWRCNENGIPYTGSHISGVNGDIHLAPVYDWVIQIGPGSATDIGGDVYKITDFDAGFTFTAKVSDGTQIQNVQTCTWTVNNTNLTETSESLSITPSAMGLSVSNIGTNATNASPITITCNVTVAGETPQLVTKTIRLYKEPVLPSFDLVDSTNMSPNTTTYEVNSLTQALSFYMFAAGPLEFPSETQIVWTIKRNGTTVAEQSGDHCSITAADMGFDSSTLPTSASAATSSPVTIECTATHPDVAGGQAASATFYVWKLTIPDVSLDITYASPTAITNSNGNSVYKLLCLSGTFQVTATLSDNSFSGAKYYWHIAKVGGNSYDTTTDANYMLSINLGNADLAAALGITQNDLSKNVNNPDVITVTCTVKHDNITDPTEWKTSSPQTVRICMPQIGLKPAPTAVGDIVFSDGSANAYNDPLDDDQKAAAIAVIFDTNGMKGVGLLQSAEQWAAAGTTGYGNITALQCAPNGTYADSATFTGVTDGSSSLARFKTAVGSTGTSLNATDYSAWSWIENYATNAGLAGTYARGWYMPSIKELCDLYNAKDTVNTCLNNLGATQMPTARFSYFWSSSQRAENSGDAWSVHFYNGKIEEYAKYNSSNYTRAIRKFN